MIRTLRLHGALGRHLGTEFRFSAGTVAELVRALCTLVPGARERLEAGRYEVVRQSPRGRRAVAEERLRIALSRDERVVHIIPRAKGKKRGGIGKVILGAVLVGVSFLIPPAGISVLGGAATITAGGVAQVGIGMALSGIGQLLSPAQKPVAPPSREDERSNYFTDAANRAAPGTPIPVLFGECVVGSVVISAGIHTERRA